MAINGVINHLFQVTELNWITSIIAAMFYTSSYMIVNAMATFSLALSLSHSPININRHTVNCRIKTVCLRVFVAKILFWVFLLVHWIKCIQRAKSFYDNTNARGCYPAFTIHKYRNVRAEKGCSMWVSKCVGLPLLRFAWITIELTIIHVSLRLCKQFVQDNCS